MVTGLAGARRFAGELCAKPGFSLKLDPDLHWVRCDASLEATSVLEAMGHVTKVRLDPDIHRILWCAER